MAEEIALIGTLEELADYATAATRMFALNLSAGVVGAATPASPLGEALLQPWLWQVTSMGLWRQPVAGSQSQTATGTVLPATMDANLRDRLEAEFSSTLKLAQPLFEWVPSDPGQQKAPPAPLQGAKPQYAWPAVLSHVSTLPAPLPQGLNLTIFFTVAVVDLAGYRRLHAAPVFSVTVNGTAYSFAAPASQPVPPVASTNTDPDAPQPGSSWAYALPAGAPNGLVLAMHQQALVIGPAASGIFPGPTAMYNAGYWITPVFEDGNEDWRTTLELRASESFDMGQQILGVLQAVGGDVLLPGATTAQLEALRVLLLSLLRDTADLGLRRAPDGSSLVRYVVERVASDPGSTLPAGFDLDGFLALAEASLQTADRGVGLSNDPTQTDVVKNWGAMLGAVLTGVTPALQPVFDATNAAWATFPTPSFDGVVRAISTLQKQLADDGTLALIAYAGWDAVLRKDATTAATWTALATQVQAELAALAGQSGLRKRMLLANLGGSTDALLTWKRLIALDVTSKLSEQDQIRANFGTTLTAYYESRFGVSADVTLDFSTRRPAISAASAGLPAGLFTALSAGVAQAGAAATSVLPVVPVQGTTAEGNPVNPSPNAHPVVLKVHGTATAADKADPLRGIAGVGMLLREYDPTQADETKQAAWTCLHVATLEVTPLAGGAPDVAAKIAFVPQRLTPRNGLVQAAIAYNNRPLSGPSPENDLTDDLAMPADSAHAPLFTYAYEPDQTLWKDPTKIDAWARMSGLKYGAWYEALGFAVRNSGALPKELAVAVDPAAPVAPIVPRPPASFTAPDGLACRFMYLRRTPVGHVRLKSDSDFEAQLTQSALTPIPATVSPMARELMTAEDPRKTLPLLLLWTSTGSTQHSQYSFTVRPPSTEFQVWNRWVASHTTADDPLQYTRAAVFADFAANAPKSVDDLNLTAQAGRKMVDTSINDAAVSALCMTLTPIYAPSAGGAVQAHYVAMTPLTALTSNFQRNDVAALVQGDHVTITTTVGPAANIQVAGQAVTVSVPQGEVWKLSIAPGVDPASAARFDKTATAPSTGLSAVTDGQFPGTGQTYICEGQPNRTLVASLTALEMLVECAVPASVTAADLWRGLRFGQPSATQPNLTLSLAPVSGAGWHLLRRVEVARQAWRWMGRPFQTGDSFPAAALPDLNAVSGPGPIAGGATGWLPGPGLTSALGWELEAFAERNYDASVSDSRVLFAPGVATDGSVAQVLFRQDLSSDSRAHYLRFGARMYSRYEGLPDFQPFAGTKAQSVAASMPFRSAAVADGYTSWVRVFVPCRVAVKLPKPKILLCVPLTASYKSGPQTSVLVIADEPWHQFAGLAEELTANVEEITPDASVPPAAGAPSVAALQIGADPIFSGAGLASATAAAWVGKPIGTTFDDVSTAPLLANTCFQFPLPALTTAAGAVAAMDWYMAKLQFRRTANAGMCGSGVTGIDSDPTDGVWVQFLPSSNYFMAAAKVSGPSPAPQPVPQSRDVTALGFGWDGGVLTFRDASGAMMLTPGSADFGFVATNLELWALVMQEITDAAGQPGEVYVGLVKYSPAGANTVSPPAAGSTYHLYLLEVQKTPGAVAGSQTWLQQIFPGGSAAAVVPRFQTMEPDATQEARYRVLRMSDRILAGA